VYIESGRKTLRQLENPIEVAREVKEVVRRWWPQAKVYVFGSTMKGACTAASDIDVLIVLGGKVSLQEVVEVEAEVYMRVDAPIQLHVATQRQLEAWYRRFTDGIVEVD